MSKSLPNLRGNFPLAPTNLGSQGISDWHSQAIQGEPSVPVDPLKELRRQTDRFRELRETTAENPYGSLDRGLE